MQAIIFRVVDQVAEMLLESAKVLVCKLLGKFLPSLDERFTELPSFRAFGLGLLSGTYVQICVPPVSLEVLSIARRDFDACLRLATGESLSAESRAVLFMRFVV